MELISVIIPVYNAEKYLEKCLNSLINQTFKELEIIVVDDGSVDNSLNIAKDIAKTDKRVKVYSKKNEGPSSARNFGLKKATGKYIGFVDSDDYVSENMYEVLHNMIVTENADMSICGWYLVENGNIRQCDFKINRQVLDSEKAIDLLLNHVSYDNFSVNKLYKKDLFENLEYPPLKVLEDLLIMYKLIMKAKKVVIDSTPLYYYVLHNNSLTSDSYKQINASAFEAIITRKNDLLLAYPKLSKKIKSNYFTASKMYFMISLNSKNRNIEFEKQRIKDMKKNIYYVWFDNSIPLRVKISSTLISISPYLYFKVRK